MRQDRCIPPKTRRRCSPPPTNSAAQHASSCGNSGGKQDARLPNCCVVNFTRANDLKNLTVRSQLNSAILSTCNYYCPQTELIG
ncbi:hypothetical protein JTB14_004320 [Gonioctena quinquepunctata]|nr:hypothetical protein JTB14_004320 [Gonioctena quinquepunctata]